MIINSGNPLSPKTYIALHNVEVNYHSIQQVTIDLCVNKHDMVVLKLAGIPANYITDYIDAPVRVTLSSGPGRSQDFCGRVLYVEPESDSRAPIVNNSPFQTIRLVCFGASMSMMGAKSKLWENVSIKSIAEQLCDTYRFSLDVIDDNFILPRLMQKGESDWAFLIRICEKYGYSVTVHGTHMHIWDPFKAIGRRPSYEELTSVSSSLGAAPGNILNFKGTFGYVTPQGYSTNYEVSSLDNDGVSQTVSSTSFSKESWSGINDPSKFYNVVLESVQTVAEAEKIVGAKERRTFPFNASVEISAGSGIVPGGIVKVTGYNSHFDGLWYVRDVKHTIGGSSYFTKLEISRDFNTSESFVVPPTQLAQTAPEPEFVAGEWRASSERVNAYV